jgi:RNA polymerase I-specific transcription initiation factor RRN7
MKAHLPGEYQRALDTETILSPDQLQTAVYRICALYTTEFGMTIPAINGPHLLFQYIKQLALPPEIYPAVKEMSDILNFNFTFTLASDSRIRRNATSNPEAQLMALVVFATKLGYPFDSDVVKRHPRSLSEPAALRYDWKKWVELRKQGSSLVERGSKLPLQRGQESNITDVDIFKMSNEQLDQYMDWYQRTYTRSTEAEYNVNKELLDMFPLKPLPVEDPQRDPEREREETQLNRLKEVLAAMKSVRPVSDEDARQLQLDSETPVEVKRPGSHYLQYRNMEELSLPESKIAKAFYEAAAEAACMSVERLVKAVWQTEAKMDAWKSEKKRAERFGENEPGNKDGDEDTEMFG